MNKKFCQYGVTIANCCRDTDCINCTKGNEDEMMDYIELNGACFMDTTASIEAILNIVDEGTIVSVDYACGEDPVLKVAGLKLHVGDYLVKTADGYGKVEKDSIISSNEA